MLLIKIDIFSDPDIEPFTYKEINDIFVNPINNTGDPLTYEAFVSYTDINGNPVSL